MDIKVRIRPLPGRPRLYQADIWGENFDHHGQAARPSEALLFAAAHWHKRIKREDHMKPITEEQQAAAAQALLKQKLEVYQLAAEWLEEKGYEAEVREDYSGRGMYGTTCPALVTDAEAMQVAFAVAEGLRQFDPELEHDMGELMFRAQRMVPERSDSMGKSKRVYY